MAAINYFILYLFYFLHHLFIHPAHSKPIHHSLLPFLKTLAQPKQLHEYFYFHLLLQFRKYFILWQKSNKIKLLLQKPNLLKPVCQILPRYLKMTYLFLMMKSGLKNSNKSCKDFNFLLLLKTRED